MIALTAAMLAPTPHDPLHERPLPPLPPGPSHPLELPTYWCDAHRNDPLSRWFTACDLLRKAWRRGGTLVHFAHANDPRRSEESQLRSKIWKWNAGDAVVPIAVRIAASYFYGRPKWIIRWVTVPTSHPCLSPTLILIPTRTLTRRVRRRTSACASATASPTWACSLAVAV